MIEQMTTNDLIIHFDDAVKAVEALSELAEKYKKEILKRFVPEGSGSASVQTIDCEMRINVPAKFKWDSEKLEKLVEITTFPPEVFVKKTTLSVNKKEYDAMGEFEKAILNDALTITNGTPVIKITRRNHV